MKPLTTALVILLLLAATAVGVFYADDLRALFGNTGGPEAAAPSGAFVPTWLAPGGAPAVAGGPTDPWDDGFWTELAGQDVSQAPVAPDFEEPWETTDMSDGPFTGTPVAPRVPMGLEPDEAELAVFDDNPFKEDLDLLDDEMAAADEAYRDYEELGPGDPPDERTLTIEIAIDEHERALRRILKIRSDLTTGDESKTTAELLKQNFSRVPDMARKLTKRLAVLEVALRDTRPARSATPATPAVREAPKSILRIEVAADGTTVAVTDALGRPKRTPLAGPRLERGDDNAARIDRALPILKGLLRLNPAAGVRVDASSDTPIDEVRVWIYARDVLDNLGPVEVYAGGRRVFDADMGTVNHFEFDAPVARVQVRQSKRGDTSVTAFRFQLPGEKWKRYEFPHDEFAAGVARLLRGAARGLLTAEEIRIGTISTYAIKLARFADLSAALEAASGRIVFSGRSYWMN